MLLQVFRLPGHARASPADGPAEQVLRLVVVGVAESRGPLQVLRASQEKALVETPSAPSRLDPSFRIVHRLQLRSGRAGRLTHGTQPLISGDNLCRVGGRREDLSDQSVRIERDWSNELSQLVGADGLRLAELLAISLLGIVLRIGLLSGGRILGLAVGVLRRRGVWLLWNAARWLIGRPVVLRIEDGARPGAVPTRRETST